MNSRILSGVILLSLLAIGFGSCSNTKNIPYFKDIPENLTTAQSVLVTKFVEPKIKDGDLLQISIQTIDPQTNNLIGSSVTAPMNIPTTGTTNNALSVSNISPQFGFIVDNSGFVELPLVGRLKVSGLTTSETQTAIRNKANLYYKDPVVNVRISNFVVTIIGEVTRPGTYPVINEHYSVLDAIGLAGDLTIFGKRSNVLLIHEEAGQRFMTRFDLRDSKIFQSPNFYIKQGDIIYVEPNRSKVAVNDQAQIRNITLGSTILTSIALIISRINF